MNNTLTQLFPELGWTKFSPDERALVLHNLDGFGTCGPPAGWVSAYSFQPPRISARRMIVAVSPLVTVAVAARADHWTTSAGRCGTAAARPMTNSRRNMLPSYRNLSANIRFSNGNLYS